MKIKLSKDCKINKTVNFFIEKWIALYKPSHNLTIDESMIAFCGRILYLPIRKFQAD